MKYKINYGNSVIVVPQKNVIDKLSKAGETELKFLLHFLSDTSLQDDYEANADSLSMQLCCDRATLDAALAFWRGADVITAAKNTTTKKVARHTSPPTYTGEELSEIINNNGLSMIIDECQRITGKFFNPTEINRIAALNSYLGLSPEYILLLFTYCSGNDKTALKYIEKVAYDLYDLGINTIEGLEEYIKNEEERKSLESRLRKLFGWGDRVLTATEKKYITVWYNDFNYGEDIITEAYNITVEKTGKLALPYLNKILTNWNKHEYHTLEDVEKALNEYAAMREESNIANSKDSFDVDEFFELSLKRSREKMLD